MMTTEEGGAVGRSGAASIEIRTYSDAERERRAAEQLSRLLDEHDPSSWRFTDLVLIQQGAIPRSHPVLRLHTRYLEDDAAALSTYLHEQLHWWLLEHPGADAALEDVRRRWPDPPGPAAGVAEGPFSTWLHLVLCPLEVLAVEQVLGTDPVDRARGPYPWVYEEVRANRSWFADLLERHGLVPPQQPPVARRWEPARDLSPHGPRFYAESSDRNQELLSLLTQLHAEHPGLTVGELDVVVDADLPTSLQPCLRVGSEFADDPEAFLLTYAFAQAVYWATTSTPGRAAMAHVPEDLAAALGGAHFGPSTAIAGTLALDMLGADASAVLARCPLGQRLAPLLPRVGEIRALLPGT